MALLVTGWVGVGLLFSATALEAQGRPDPRLEGRMLREASSQEAAGNLEGAEATLRDLLDRQPRSSGAVFSLERVLRSRGTLKDLFPLIDAHLAADPSSGAARFLKVKVLAETDSVAALESTIAAWIEAEPESADPYREGSRVYNEALGADRAVDLIERGLAALGDSPVLLIELGDLNMSEGRLEDGAAAWANALGRDRAQTQAVFRRLDDLEDPGPAAALVVQVLAEDPTTVPRLEVGAELALRQGLESEAQVLAGAAVEKLENREAKGFLNGFAKKAEDAGAASSALWAYQQLRRRVSDPVEGRSTDERLAAAAIAVGDSAVAFEALQRITASYPQNSEERRTAWVNELRVQVGVEEPAEAVVALDRFREAYPQSQELDGLAAAVASRLLGSGEREQAMEVLDGIEGPGAALERAYLLLENGSIGEGVLALRDAVPTLEPADATEVIQLTLLLSRLSPPGAALAADVATQAHRGNVDSSIQLVRESGGQLALDDQPAVFALGARAAARGGRTQEAIEFWRRILSDHPGADEVPDAALRLARALSVQPGGGQQAVQILETLILDHPSSPVVPDARRELRRLRENGT
ncbi:MAG: tetratricopeptide repeat protein [Longimicrobiales bacterium]